MTKAEPTREPGEDEVEVNLHFAPEFVPDPSTIPAEILRASIPQQTSDIVAPHQEKLERPEKEKSTSLVAAMATRLGVDPKVLWDTLRRTIWPDATTEELFVLCSMAQSYGLNPLTRELLIIKGARGRMIPYVPVDGWARIIASHPDFDGMTVEYSGEVELPDGKKGPAYCRVAIYRKGFARPIQIDEYLEEVYVPPFERRDGKGKIDGPWQTHTRRMLRHKAVIQCARLAFGLVGIYDPDEAQRIRDARAQEASHETR